jgi:hypothetical protein
MMVVDGISTRCGRGLAVALSVLATLLYYDEANKTWRYPPQGGYQLTPEGQPVKMQLSLFAGQRIDRFGSEFGGYLSPEGTPYSARAIPPQSLDTKTNPTSCNYSRYKVLQTIPVYAGRSRAAWHSPASACSTSSTPRSSPDPRRGSTSATS